MKYLNKFRDVVNYVYIGFGVLMLLVIAVACILQVFTRYVLGSSMVGTEEVSRYCFIWLGFTGSAICVRNWSNAHISILNDLLKGKLKTTHSIFLNCMVFICAAVLFVQGFKCVNITANQLSSMLRIPMSYIYAAIPVGAVGMMLNALLRTLNLIFPTKEVQE